VRFRTLSEGARQQHRREHADGNVHVDGSWCWPMTAASSTAGRYNPISDGAGAYCAMPCRITGEDVLPQGSGRTDAGVHALGQVASFALAAPIPEANLARALNRTLPPSIRVLSASPSQERFSCAAQRAGKDLRIQNFSGRDLPALASARYVYALNARWMWMRCSERRPGFWACTTSLPLPPATPIRPAMCAACMLRSGREEEDQLLLYRVRGNGFLHHMVRNLVGTFLEVGRGKCGGGGMAAILKRAPASERGRPRRHEDCSWSAWITAIEAEERMLL
jgi:tRNA pseudouridine38-40 synthase